MNTNEDKGNFKNDISIAQNLDNHNNNQDIDNNLGTSGPNCTKHLQFLIDDTDINEYYSQSDNQSRRLRNQQSDLENGFKGNTLDE